MVNELGSLERAGMPLDRGSLQGQQGESVGFIGSGICLFQELGSLVISSLGDDHYYGREDMVMETYSLDR